MFSRPSRRIVVILSVLLGAVALRAPAAEAWQPLFGDEGWYREQEGQERVFAGTLEAIPDAGGIGILQRTHHYRLGDRKLFTGARKHPALDRLVGRKVEVRGKAVDVELEGQNLREIWPSAVRPAQREGAPADRGGPKVRVACVGDSITFGSGLRDRDRTSYPAQLQAMLGDGYEVRNFGVSGATLLKDGDKPWWKEKAFEAATEFAPQVVVIKLGTNDSKPQNWRHKDRFAADLRALVEHFAGLESRPKVYVCRPVPAYPGNWGIRDEVIRDELLPILDETARALKVPTIDLYTALSGRPEFFPDKVHPNAAGARAMAQVIAAALTGKPAPATRPTGAGAAAGRAR